MFEDLDLELIKNEIYTQAILNVYEKFNEKEYEKTINKNFTGAHYNSSYIINQKLVESVETLFGIFIEKYIIKFLKQNFKIINLSITQKSDYTILDENSNDLYLCELKTNRKTFNNDSLKSTNSKLENIEKNVLDLNLYNKIYKQIHFIDDYTNFRKSGDTKYFLNSKESSLLLFDNENFLYNLKNHINSIIPKDYLFSYAKEIKPLFI